MSFYKLKKSDYREGSLSISPKYVTNGHWRVFKASLTDSVMLKDVKTAQAFIGNNDYINNMTDEMMEEVTPKRPLDLKLTRTNRIHTTSFNAPNHKEDRVVFESEDGKTEVTFNRRYIEIFDLTTLYGKDDTSAFTDEDGIVVIMPKKL